MGSESREDQGGHRRPSEDSRFYLRPRGPTEGREGSGEGTEAKASELLGLGRGPVGGRVKWGACWGQSNSTSGGRQGRAGEGRAGKGRAGRGGEGRSPGDCRFVPERSLHHSARVPCSFRQASPHRRPVTWLVSHLVCSVLPALPGWEEGT